MSLSEKQAELLTRLSKEDRETLASIIRDKDVDGDYTGWDSDEGCSFYQDDARATLNTLAYMVENFDPNCIHWE